MVRRRDWRHRRASHLGQAMIHHPHVHCVVPGGGLSPDRSTWMACRPDFFLPCACCHACSNGSF
ncbi:hypothetical protein SMB554_20495 (plasmid) [Sinorhizobium meliloti]|nr:hypothetical protein SMB554_20495 [Sinorhizobium meliloti]